MDPVALTFDDGPDATWTPILLHELDRLEVTATFFVVGPLARRNPGLVHAIAEHGHSVELHCWAHVRHSVRTRDDVEADTDRALAELAAIGIHPTRWRTPWGDVAPWTAAVAAERQLTLTGWTADTHDWRGDPMEQMMAALAPGPVKGDVVLMHDGIGPGARRSDCLQTVRLLAPLCERIRTLGLEVGPLQTPLAPVR